MTSFTALTVTAIGHHFRFEIFPVLKLYLFRMLSHLTLYEYGLSRLTVGIVRYDTTQLCALREYNDLTDI